VGHNDRALVPDIAVPYGVDDIGDVLLASDNVGVTGMFVVDSGKLDKRDRRQPIVVEIVQELCLILQVRVGAGRVWIERWRASVICVWGIKDLGVFGEVGEWLLLELEYYVRIVRRLRFVL